MPDARPVPLASSDRARAKSAGTLLREGNIPLHPVISRPVVRPRWQVNPRGRIVLLQPRVGYIDNMRSKPAMPLSLLHAVSLAVENYDVVVIDQRVHHDWRLRLQREVDADPLLSASPATRDR